MVRSNPLDTLADVDTVAEIAVALVVLEANERQGTNVQPPNTPVVLLNGQGGVKGTRLAHFEVVAVPFIAAADVASKRVEAVSPPEAGTLIAVEGQGLLGKRFGRISMYRQVTIQKVIDLGPVFQVIAVPLA